VVTSHELDGGSEGGGGVHAGEDWRSFGSLRAEDDGPPSPGGGPQAAAAREVEIASLRTGTAAARETEFASLRSELAARVEEVQALKEAVNGLAPAEPRSRNSRPRTPR
jgi:hypothetical protein